MREPLAVIFPEIESLRKASFVIIPPKVGFEVLFKKMAKQYVSNTKFGQNC